MQQVDDPPFLPVGTEVSAKYKGAFCEAKVRKVVRNIKCKIAYKQGLGSGTVSDELIKGVLRVGATVEVKHPDKREYVEASITKIQDCSQYTVVFDDGDITTLRRTALCLKSGRHFNESETLDQLPLTHPEHFGNPVIGGRRGRRHLHDESSDEDDEIDSKAVINEKEEHIGKVVCVESTETKKKDKEKWFPALVVSPTAQVTVRIRVKDEYLVRSFKDGRYYTVPKKEATEFTREMATKQDGAAVQAALQYLDNTTLPPHWDKDALFGLANSSSEYEGELDSDSSDDEPREEKDHFVAQLYKYMDDRGTPLNKVPSITNRDVDLYRLFRAVQKLGGYNRVTSQNQWKVITMRLGLIPVTVSVTNLVKQAYKKFLQPFEEFDRKLGCSMSMTPRNANRSKGRSLVRANSVASPKPEIKEPKILPPPVDESENTSESSTDISKSKRKLSTGSGKVKSVIEKFEEKIKEETVEPIVPIVAPAKVVKSKEVKEEPAQAIASTSSIGSTGTAVTNKKEKATKKAITASQEEKRNNRKQRKEGIEANESKTTEVAAEKDKDFTVEVGDKLNVYYHEKKVTYEAKVIETSLQQGVPFYLVHYTGWNTRYDEWVPRERIAENLTQNKSKRTKSGMTATSQKASANVPPNDGNKGLGSGVDKSSLTVTTLTTNLSTTKTTSGSKRGRGRSDSTPRSITPSSMASSTGGRTKSPAAQSVRRTTRAQPSTSRRTSNNVSDVSMPTDSDSDSDTPVKKPTRLAQNAIASVSPGPSTLSKSGSTKTSIATNSQSETEEEEIPVSVTKGRDYDLNQIRSELKGFKELKSPSPESEPNVSITDEKRTAEVFNFDTTEDIGKKPTLSAALSKVAIESKSSTDLSSETDSFGDDDSQSSDKTTMLENMTEKFQQKIAQGKCIERLGGPGADKVSLKVAGIEKIIEDSLMEKMQHESMKSSKSFAGIEKNLFKPVESETKTEVIETSQLKSPVTIDRKLKSTLPHAEKKHLLADTKPGTSKTEKKSTIVADNMKSHIKKELPTEIIAPEKMNSSLGSPTDIYEFKEPEPFEFEARKSSASVISSPSPEVSDKKSKKFGPKATETVAAVVETKIPVATTTTAKKNKKSPTKDSDKTKIAKIEKVEEKPIVAEIFQPAVLLTPSKKIETTFDVLRKSPSFNLNVNAGIDDLHQLIPQESLKPAALDTSPEKLPPTSPPAISQTQSIESVKKSIPFISPFVETLKESPKAFDLKADVSAIEKESPEKSSKSVELETVKRVLAHDPALILPPSKSDKGKVSIADKLLKALNQQKQEEPKPKDEPPLVPPVIEAPHISSFTPITEPPKIELPAIIKKEIEIPVKKPILSSPEPKLDILESIAPKNNDLSETIQKLESVIRNRSEGSHYDDDSSDSTDSERRLVIEDDSQSSETNQTDIAGDTAVDPKKPLFGEDNSFSIVPQDAFKVISPILQKSAFNLHIPLASISSIQTSEMSTSIIGSEIVGVGVGQFKLSDEVTLKQLEKSPSDLHISALSFAIKKEDMLHGQESGVAAGTQSMSHNEAINLLLCEETIPGSPAPSRECADLKLNIHPTDSDIKHIPMDIECPIPTSTMSHDDDGGDGGGGGGGSGISSDKMKADTNTPTSSPRDSISQDDSGEDVRKGHHGQDLLISPKKRRHTRKHSEGGASEPITKRRRHNTNVSKRNNGSDSEDNSDADISQRSNRSSRPCQYNFMVELDPAMNPNQRIAILNKTIADLRKTYNMIKAELASIDRRRKKLRRREREKKIQQKINS